MVYVGPLGELPLSTPEDENKAAVLAQILTEAFNKLKTLDGEQIVNELSIARSLVRSDRISVTVKM